MIDIKDVDINFIREPLLAPFGFKGGYLNELWQVVCCIKSEDGYVGVGVGVQSVLWSDSVVFSANSQSGGNAAMLLVTQYALNLVKGKSFDTPPAIIETIFEDTFSYAKQVTQYDNLRKTFVLNALVPVDFALWQLYAQKTGTQCFDTLAGRFTSALNYKHTQLGMIPLITYGMTVPEVIKLADEGAFLFKIKIGSDPDKDGNRSSMLEWDKHRLFEIHEALKEKTTPYTNKGKALYYLDANGRYDTRERLLEFAAYAEKIGALQHIILFEEPFHEGSGIDVHGIPLRIAGDESAHCADDIKHLVSLGYTAIALKPVAKTMSMSLKILEEAHQRGIPCFCADLTVNPYMVDWNKNVACRIEPLPGIKIGVLESNGEQNYKNWRDMKGFHPCCNAGWIEANKGIYTLSQEFYHTSGGIFNPPLAYKETGWGIV